MPTAQGVFAVPEMSTDSRIRVFRRTFDAVDEFEGMEVDAYFIITTTTAVMLDTLLCPEDVEYVMHMIQDDITGKRLLIVNSHADWDHAWGNAYFTGTRAAPILAHEHGRMRMQSEEARLELTDFQQRYALFHNVTLVPPTITFSQNLTIYGGDLTIKLFPAPGHHRDHIAAWIPELRLLLAFDAVEKPLPCLENASAVPSMMNTLEHFLALEAERVLCSHGKTISPQLIKDNLTYIHELERRASTFLQQHQPTSAELEYASETIHYPFDEVIAELCEPVDRTFYSEAHNTNARYVLEWLMQNYTN